MRSLLAAAIIAILAIGAMAQQQNENKEPAQPPPAQKKAQKQPPPLPKPEEPAAKTTEPAPAPPEQKAGDDKDKDRDKKEEHYDVTEVAPIVTHHQITLAGKALKYTASAGRLPIKRADGKIEAEMFFVAYTLDGQEGSKRPLTFAFNGGPGSASIWLHMGALGPRRAALSADGFLPAAPYRVEDNPYTTAGARRYFCWERVTAPRDPLE